LGKPASLHATTVIPRKQRPRWATPQTSTLGSYDGKPYSYSDIRKKGQCTSTNVVQRNQLLPRESIDCRLKYMKNVLPSNVDTSTNDRILHEASRQHSCLMLHGIAQTQASSIQWWIRTTIAGSTRGTGELNEKRVASQDQTCSRWRAGIGRVKRTLATGDCRAFDACAAATVREARKWSGMIDVTALGTDSSGLRTWDSRTTHWYKASR